MIRSLALILLLPVAASSAEPDKIHLTPGPEPTQELFDVLLEQDRVLFDAAFNACEPDRAAPLIHEHFEFLHDKWGQIAGTGAEFLTAIRETCEKRKTGENFAARRELVRDSLTVHPMAEYGAMQMGTHRFYAVQPGKPDRMTEVGKFIHVWKREGEAWKLTRVISYDHRLAEPAP